MNANDAVEGVMLIDGLGGEEMFTLSVGLPSRKYGTWRALVDTK